MTPGVIPRSGGGVRLGPDGHSWPRLTLGGSFLAGFEKIFSTMLFEARRSTLTSLRPRNRGVTLCNSVLCSFSHSTLLIATFQNLDFPSRSLIKSCGDGASRSVRGCRWMVFVCAGDVGQRRWRLDWSGAKLVKSTLVERLFFDNFGTMGPANNSIAPCGSELDFTKTTSATSLSPEEDSAIITASNSSTTAASPIFVTFAASFLSCLSASLTSASVLEAYAS